MEIVNVHSIGLYLLFIILYVNIDSINWISTMEFRLLTILNVFVFHFWLYIHEQYTIGWTIFSLLLFYLLISLNELAQSLKELQHTYESILGEYRKMKRQIVESERAARLEERTKIARDIHDSVGHKMTALLMKLNMLSIQEKKVEYEQLKELATASLEETRHAVKALQNEEIEGISSVLQLIRKLEAESHIHLDFTLKKGVLSTPLNNTQSIVLYRVLQESLTNAMRHAYSREVKVVLALNAVGDLEFKIENKVHQDTKTEWGFGLTNMKKRLEEINGTLQIYQRENTFVVTGIIPLGEE